MPPSSVSDGNAEKSPEVENLKTDISERVSGQLLLDLCVACITSQFCYPSVCILGREVSLQTVSRKHHQVKRTHQS